MRVLAFCDYYSANSSGGAERVAREIYTRLARDHQIDVTVVGTGSADSCGWFERRATSGVREVFVPGHDLSAVLGAQLTLSAALPAVIRGLRAALLPTVLHANSLHFQSTLLAARLAHRLDIPLVTTAHIGSTDALPGRMRWAARGWDATLGRYVVRRSKRLVAVSYAAADHIERLGAAPSRVSIAHNGVDHETFHPGGRLPRVGALRIGYVGRLIANKGPDLLLDAVGLASSTGLDLEVTVIGDGPMRTALMRRAAHPDLAGRIRFTGQVDDVAAYLRQLDVVVRPSYTEGLPLGVLEAMACGVVVVCSDVPGNLEVVSDGETGLVFQTGNRDQLAAALARLADHPELLTGLADKAASRAADFSWDVATQVHLEALRSASEHKSSR